MGFRLYMNLTKAIRRSIHQSMIRPYAICAASLMLFASPAWAAPTPEDVALSEALFREGKSLLQEGKFDVACPKLAESHRLDPAGGTIVTLGLCYEAAGKTATAWVVFGDALASAERDKRTDRIKLTKEHIAALEKRLSYLTIELAPEGIGTSEFTLTRDGAKIARAALGTASAVDPGKHVINLSAEGFTPQIIEVDVKPDGDRKKVVIPPLVRIPEKPVDRPMEKPIEKPVEKPIEKLKPIVVPVKEKPPQRLASSQVGALILGGVSVVAFGAGGYFGLHAKSQHDEALELCPASPCPNERGVQQNQSAKESATVSNGLFAAGVGSLTASIVIWFAYPHDTSPSKTSSNKVILLPVIGSASASALVVGSF